MPKPHVFIASSGEVKALASWTATQLRKNGAITAVAWHPDSFEPSETPLQSLARHARTSDFAVVFLTEDDWLAPDASTGQPLAAPRDNCVFEAGLFIGALGLNPRRCVLVSSLAEDTIFSDMRGVTTIPIPSVPNDAAHQWCEDNLRRAVEKLRTMFCGAA